MIDARRLRRALLLRASPAGDSDRWQVSGGSRSHLIVGGRCDCEDFAFRGVECSHLLAVRLSALDSDLRGALVALVHNSTEVAR